jgi:hypothetical protein
MTDYYKNRSSRNGMRGMDWIYLARDKDRRRPVPVNAVIKRPGSLKHGELHD